MKTKIIAVLLLVCVLLVGCDVSKILDNLPEKEYSCGDVSITLPGNFIDYSGKDEAKDKEFLFANKEIGIAGVQENKKELFELFGKMDDEGYAKLIADINELDTTAEEKDGYWHYTYEEEIDGDKYTYLNVFHETSADFWNIQVHCKSDLYDKNADTMWKYATTIKIKDNGPSDTEELDPTEAEPTETDPTEPEVDPTEGEAVQVSIDLPDDFLNYSNTALAGDYAFMYANEEIGIIGIQENKEELFLYFDEMDLEGYANLISELYGLDDTAEEKDGFWTVSYTDDSTGASYTYIGVFYETEVDFWHVQAYCLTEQYEEKADDIWQYITSVEFAEN